MRDSAVRDDQIETASERSLIEGLIDGDPIRAAQLLKRIRPLMRSSLSHHHARLRDWHDEILGAAELRLFEWQASDPCRLRADEKLADLAQRVVRQEAARERRYRRATRDAKVEERSFADPQDEADAALHQREVTDVMQSLPEDVGAVLLTHCQHEVGDGRPLDVVLGVTPEAARKRLERARATFFQALLARGLVEKAKEPS